jgi:MFS family permease
MTFALATAAQLSIRKLLPKPGPRAAITPGLLLAAAGAFLLTRLGSNSDYVNLVLPATLVFGAGLDMVISTSTATAGITPADAGAASALVNVGQQVGGSIGTSLLNTLAASAITSYAAPTPAPRTWPPPPPCTATTSASPGPPPSCWPPPLPPPRCCAARPQRPPRSRPPSRPSPLRPPSRPPLPRHRKPARSA